jgi:hypothetical protein
VTPAARPYLRIITPARYGRVRAGRTQGASGRPVWPLWRFRGCTGVPHGFGTLSRVAAHGALYGSLTIALPRCLSM